MATISNVSNKKVLIVDSMPEIRNQLQMSLSSLGFEKLHGVSSIREAMDKIAITRYDVILCDYNLGEGTTGQQFLEYLRTHDVLARNAMFIIVTAENAYENVVMAAECEPDDYLLKPFTAAQFLSRFERLLERQLTLEAIDQAYAKKDWPKVVVECNKLLAQKNKFFVDLCKIKAAALMQLEQYQQALDIYDSVVRMRELPWAELGQSKAQAKLGNSEISHQINQSLIEKKPEFVATYDFASELSMQENRAQEAFEILKQASKIFPGNLNRTRMLTGLAMANGEHALAETLMSDVLKKHRHSPVRECADFALLSRALTEQGKPQDALKTLKDAEQHFKDPQSAMVLAASASIAHQKAGNDEAAQTALAQALSGDTSQLPPSVAMHLAEACFAAGKEAEANNLLRQVLQNHPDDARLQAKVKTVCALAGKNMEETSALIQDSAKEIIRINNEGVRKAQAGQYQEAIQLITDAALRLPNNLNIISNAALIYAVSYASSQNQDELQQCLQFRQRVVDKQPSHPKLTQIDNLLKNAKKVA